MMVKGMCCSYGSDATISHMNPRSRVMIIFIVGCNGIGEAGAQALAKGLQHWTNLQELA